MKSSVEPAIDQVIRGVPRACPVCGSWESKKIFDNRMVPCAGYGFSAPIVQCAPCGSAYAGTALPADDLNRNYAKLSKYDTLSSSNEVSPLDKERAAMATAFLAPLLPSISSVLDVGCSAGFFLSKVRDAGVATVVGIDPAPQAEELARTVFNVAVSTAQAEAFDDYGKFDLVCLMAVLEHLLDPRRFLSGVATQLKAGARVLIEVPDAGAFDRPETKETIEPFGEFSNEHINFFSIGDIRRIANEVGLEVERWQSFRSLHGSPGVFALLRKARASAVMVAADRGSTPSCVHSQDAISRYVATSLRVMQEVEKRLLADCRGSVLIYGAGNHTCRLLAQSPALADCEVPAVFDRNPHLHGARIGDSKVFPPDAIGAFPGLSILVSTFIARREIHAALRADTSRPIVLLYD